ncbi:hypothetical protein [Amycolatopsis sp. NPDC051716]|uniref:hypothetical protein n=1 Tax=Amycolatopsis sp. NPDC051716 TaxID=3155804 RepID=UPI0034285CD8
MQYTQRAIVISAAEYTAGLQFHTVIVVSSSNPEEAYKNTSASRAIVSQLYLACSRAELELHCVALTGDTEVGNILRSAADLEIATSE